MKAALYLPGGEVAVQELEEPALPDGGLLIRTEASGLCSGELMSWYMESKAPHVLGHEVAGIVAESGDGRFPVGCRVFAHHHAACGHCAECRRGNAVFCEQWKRTRLIPGGMAERFAVPQANLTETLRVDDMRARDAALIEPLGCVVKSIRRARLRGDDRVAVIGLGVMGLMHMLLLPAEATAYEIRRDRREWAEGLGLRCGDASRAEPADVVFVCPSSEDALRFALSIAAHGARLVLFAPLPPEQQTAMDLGKLYFEDYEFVNSYSCGPEDVFAAAVHLRAGRIAAEQVVSDFIGLAELPSAYRAMKDGEILKAMVEFD